MAAEVENKIAVNLNLDGASWHGLDIDASQHELDPWAFARAAGIDWETYKIPNEYRDPINPVTIHKLPFGKTLEVPNMIRNGTYNLVRSSDHKVLDECVTEDWKDISNAETINYFEQFAKIARDNGKGQFRMASSGSLKEGKVTFLTAWTGDEFVIRDGGKTDQQCNRLSLVNRHEYGTSLAAMLTGVRIVCMNTVNHAVKSAKSGIDGNMIRVNHRQDFAKVQHDVTEYLKISADSFKIYQEKMEFLTQIHMSDEMVKTVLSKTFPITGKNEKEKDLSLAGRRIFEIYQSGEHKGSDIMTGRAYNVLQAGTYYFDHLAGHNDDTRQTSATIGVAAGQKIDWLENLISVALASNSVPVAANTFADNGFAKRFAIAA